MPRISKQDAESFIANVRDEYVFRFGDGSILRNMKELGDALNAMSVETFAFHALSGRNDFSNWVRDVIHDEKLSRDLSRTKSQKQAAKAVAERLSFLQSRLAEQG